ncbi:MAG: PPC domain-containing protein [Myxococcaceae bacterium]|nr:PPC domain-containing protein [Myxococcaceae bacterium]
MKTTLRLALLFTLAACGVDDATVSNIDDVIEGDEKRIASAVATAMEFTFNSSLWVPGTVSASGARSYIDEQLLFTIGHLNGNNSVGRLDKIVLSNLKTSPENGGTLVTFTVKLPVSWGSKTSLPTTYNFVLPRDTSYAGVEAFTTKYVAKCIDAGAHDVDSGSIWYYYRPRRSGCVLADADVVKTQATVAVSPENTTGKYPEYHKVWEDNVLTVVAIFGKYEDGATTSSDAGIAAFAAFVRAISAELKAFGLVTTPAMLPTSAGISTPDITFEATLADGKKVKVVALLVDNVRTAGATFDARYAELSTRADLIAYNGHAGLGANVRALSTKGRFVAGQYAVFFMNGCDTYAYVDGSLASARARLNPDDPTGTKYMEFITNGMPAFFSQMSGASMALIRGLMKPSAPLTYEQMFKNIDKSQVVLVTGEEDNVFVPGFDGGGPRTGYVQLEGGSADKGQELRYQTQMLPAGKVTVTMTGAAGDADLYVRVGQAPTATAYDCRPYAGGSNEECAVSLAAPGIVYVSVIGYAAGANAFELRIVGPASAVGPQPDPWAGMNETGTVTKNQEKRFTTPTLQPGRYTFTMTGTGDADLYVRGGVAPTATDYDCRPYANGSAETCTLNLSVASPIHVMVRGYAASSTFTLVARP